MGLLAALAWRMAFSRLGRLYRVISLLSVAGITVAVAALLVVMAVMDGFRREFVGCLLRAEPHVTVRALGTELVPMDHALARRLARVQGVASVQPFLVQEVLVARGAKAVGGVVRAVGASSPQTGAVWVAGGPAPGAVALGKEIASRVAAAVGDTVLLATFLDAGGERGPSVPRVKLFPVSGLLDLGLYQHNNSVVALDLPSAQEFYRTGSVISGFELRVEDPWVASLVARRVMEEVGYPYYATSWQEQNRPMFQMLSLQKRALFLVLSLMILVAGANVVSGLVSLVSVRRRDIGMLMAMGLARWKLAMLFLGVGLVVGSVGLALGLLLSLGAVGVANASGVLTLAGDVYQVERLPLRLSPEDVALVSVVTLGVALLFTVAPAVRASRLMPIDILRYE